MKFEDMRTQLHYVNVSQGEYYVRYTNDVIEVDGIKTCPFLTLHADKNFSQKNKWMSYNYLNNYEAKEQCLEYRLAYGKVILTGLGLGVLPSMLELNDRVDSIVIYESNQSVINFFKFFCQISNFHPKKIQIIKANANHMKGETCDCLFLDHYELEPYPVILRSAEYILSNNTCNIFWHYPGTKLFLDYCKINNIEVSKEEFYKYTNMHGIPKVPELTDEMIEDIKKFHDLHKALI